MKKYLDLADKSEYYYLKDNAIVTKLPEIGYMEELHDEDWYEKSYIWFYVEWYVTVIFGHGEIYILPALKMATG